ncbi:bromodomain testis-specific protein [Rhynchospora pubera]|uniref:Bromodomain testis-specific protein n=1 Tax=Rhynchospora pubera TaxID=906938 RepID=A0AAV8CP41_9POAL|nr:bromodomain testis-specific protein [Rhynchospora pubera]
MSNDLSNNKDGPDFIGYYRHLFRMQISEIEERSPSSQPVQLFCKSLGGGLSYYAKSKLMSVLHEAADALNKEADELLGKIIAKLEAESNLGQSCFSGKFNEGSTPEPFIGRKRKMPIGSNFSQSDNDFCNSELDEQVHTGLQSADANGVHEESTEKYSADLLHKLCKMEEGVEEFLNEVVLNCRTMTSAEKQLLGSRIQNLPEKAYDRLIEIFQMRNPFSRQNSDCVFINLDKQDTATLWRLYYYVETVRKASKT